MERVLKFPSLEHLSMVRIVSDAWEKQDVWALFSQQLPETRKRLRYLPLMAWLFTYDDRPDNSSKKEWLDVEDKVLAQISALPAPEIMKKQMANLVKPLGREIVNFYVYYLLKDEHYFAYIMNSPEPVAPPVRWSAWGTVDWKKSAELYARNEQLNVEARYRFACLNCLEEDVCRLIHLISENYRNSLLNIEVDLENDGPSCDEDIIALWTRSVVSGENHITRNIEDYVIRYCSPAACQYCFENSSQEYKVWFLNYFYDSWIGDYQMIVGSVPYFFWLLLNDMEEVEFFKECEIWFMLNCMLRWPWQPLFIETAKRASRFMDEDDFISLLNDIARVILAGFKDYDYGQLLQEFWLLCPANVTKEFPNKQLFAKTLLESEEKELCQLILSVEHDEEEDDD